MTNKPVAQPRAEQPTRPDSEAVDGPLETIDGFETGNTVAPNTPAPSGDAVEVWRKALDAYLDIPPSRDGRALRDNVAAAIIEAAINARCEPLVKALEAALDAPMIDHSYKKRGVYDIIRVALAQHREGRP